ncbi:aminoacyl-histidine dipeptidase [Candidatus Arthromitus sp. SFB-mouse-Japan]|uniref:aminoacyl-histidine dipeptidase n=1 Tax=unclassified Candidatus Neoarthromitus TaxID=2638829 RepID=UPI00021B7D22|nr:MULTISPECIES: aminoacyl-histidine dipeptidase [unclassified Candidatus Arthromitus]EIA21686.1 Aminoacyl-histidine dipeptidase [Candidatus Arthromitus sp. SFB-1]EIA22233.1 Aminoacyl-histidine dipeptidase [Candidatus Arthromitus sp. SFB-2]EIA22780.1 Aminoacyl-histidine dipeptidase [Candidatus Arthromitus sp. SFB-3]EIA26767.1 Aminoacyl-histidine dipeptidase [Candidatus Arthromitus sp. SFB-4]EIA27059.1 Aminoacyl-histidine dipeptidase [Candidatus Arthromitus sp. SFB-co]EIA31227.1 Aminoacyl-hist
MSRVLDNIEPREVFKYFEDISMIPRPSNDEKRISDYLMNFAKELGIEVVQDKSLNIYMRKPATKGYENGKTVILQGHMDMVCEKNEGIDHDFYKDPLKLRIIEDKIYATDTTLGADNGIAVAYIMAIMASKDIEHPEIEALITVGEETSMVGAKSFEPKFFRGKYLINIDSVDDSNLLVSCAGGLRAIVMKKVTTEELNGCVISIKVKGLRGGHSGIDINKERGNANKILSRILINVEKNYSNINIVSISGGAKDNAIPREAKCEIRVDKEDIDNVILSIKSAEDVIRGELEGEENFFVEVFKEDIPLRPDMINSKDSKDLIELMYLMPNGIISNSVDIEGLVVTSNNFGVIEYDGETVILKNAVRSSIGSAMYNVAREIDVLSRAFRAVTKESSPYPGWKYEKDSKLRDISQEAYREIFDGEMGIYAIHAGVECGIIKEKLPDLDMVSFGPLVKDNHTPGEWVSISSTGKVWTLLKGILKKIK